jgi:hypothetical protein
VAAPSTNVVGVGPIWPAGSPFQGLTDCVSGAGCGRAVWEHGFAFTVLTVILAGGCALMSGRALALSWRPVAQLALYMALFGCAVRFLHYGLFRGTLLSPHYYLIDTAVLLLISIASYRYTRASMMTRQYFWLYKRTGPFSWRLDADAQTAANASTPQAGA